MPPRCAPPLPEKTVEGSLAGEPILLAPIAAVASAMLKPVSAQDAPGQVRQFEDVRPPEAVPAVLGPPSAVIRPDPSLVRRSSPSDSASSWRRFLQMLSLGDALPSRSLPG